MQVTDNDLISFYDLKPLPGEGGFFRRSYTSVQKIDANQLLSNLQGDRFFSTTIYYLLPRGAKSKLHLLNCDEIWHFYLGVPLVLFQIFPDGKTEKVILGSDFQKGHKIQHQVPKGCWFGGHPLADSFSFFGCTCVPGFEIEDFKLGSRVQLLDQFPHAREIIEMLTDEV